MSNLSVVVLAAGKGTRMRSALPKVLHPLAGRPLLAHVLDAARALQPARIIVVYGHGGQAVPDSFRGQRRKLRAPGTATRNRARRHAGAAASAQCWRDADPVWRRAAHPPRHPAAAVEQARCVVPCSLREWPTRPATAASCAMPAAACSASSRRRTPVRTSSASTRSTPASCPRRTPGCATGWRGSPTTTRRGSTTFPTSCRWR